MFVFNADSLKRGRVSKEECLEVLADPFKTYYDACQSKRGNPRRMWVGYTLASRQLEIGVEYMKYDIDLVYHARKAQKETIRKAICYE